MWAGIARRLPAFHAIDGRKVEPTSMAAWYGQDSLIAVSRLKGRGKFTVDGDDLIIYTPARGCDRAFPGDIVVTDSDGVLTVIPKRREPHERDRYPEGKADWQPVDPSVRFS